MTVKVKKPIPIAFVYQVKVKQCLFCSFTACLCSYSFRQLVEADL